MGTIAAPIMFGQVGPQQVATDTNPSEALLASAVFEVASIHPDKPSADGRISIKIGFSPNGTFSASGIPLKKLLSLAYGVDESQVIGGPGWLASDRYTLEAKADSTIQGQLPKLNNAQRKLLAQHMLQALFADRLKLTVHQETKEVPILALVVGKNGLKIHESTPGDTYPNGMKGPDGQGHGGMMRFDGGKITAQGISLDGLANLLTEQLHNMVQNKTGLKGNYDFSLEFAPDEHDGPMPGPGGGGEPGGGTATDSQAPSIYTAIQEQLGLKLESQKGPIPVYVIDHVEKPSHN